MDRALVAVPLLFVAGLVGCDAAKSDFSTTCDAVKYSGADGPPEVQLQTALAWVAPRMKSNDGKGAIAALRVEGTSPRAAASLLGDRAKAAGVDGACPLADAFAAAEAQWETDDAFHRLCHTRWEHVRDGEIIVVTGQNGLTYTKEIPSQVKDLHAALVAAKSRADGRLLLLDALAANASHDSRPGYWSRETPDTCWLAQTLVSPD